MRTSVAFAFALLSSGCGDPTTSNAPSGGSNTPTTLGTFAIASQTPLRPWRFLGLSGHAIAFNSVDELIVENPSAPDPDSELGCAEILKFAKDQTLAATIPYDKSSPPVAPFVPCPFSVNVAIDSKDAIVTAAVITADSTSFDIVLRKLDKDGKTLWTQYQYGKTGYVAYLVDLAIDSDDNIVVATLSQQEAGPTRPQVAKYDAQGNLLWTHALENPIATGIQKLQLDRQNGIWLDVITENPTGRYVGRLSPEGTEMPPMSLEGNLGRIGNDFVLMHGDAVQKYSIDGKPLWKIPFGSEVINDAKGRNVSHAPSVDLFAPDGSLYGVGSVKVGESPTSLGNDIVVIVQRDSSNGRLVNGWSLELPGANNHVYDRAMGKDGRIAFRHDDFVGIVAPLD